MLLFLMSRITRKTRFGKPAIRINSKPNPRDRHWLTAEMCLLRRNPLKLASKLIFDVDLLS